MTNNEADDGNPQWSPDGTRIVFESYRDGQAEIYVMNADGSGQTRLTSNGAFDGMPSWSPDGTKIAFSSSRSGAYRIWVMNADGSNPVQLSNQPYSFRPQWSPDGTRIAYDSDGDNDGWQELWVMNVDGSGQNERHQEYNNTDLWNGSWSPDGRYIAYTQIHFVYYQGNWYWDYAYQKAIVADNYDAPISLSQNDRDWYPRWQTIDGQPPVSQVQALSAQSPGPIPVSWSGTDTGGSGGIANYDVQVKTGANGSWTNWLMGTTATTGHYPGTGGNTYYFRVRARDLHYSIENWPPSHDATTTVEALPPQSYIQTLPPYSRQDNSPLMIWNGFDPGGSGIASYDVQYRLNNSTWQNWLMNTPATAANFDNSNGDTGDAVYFRIRAADRAQNEAPWPAPGSEISTTLYAWGMQGFAYDNTDTPVSGISVGMDPASMMVVSDDSDGQYNAFTAAPATNYEVNWTKNGYGGLPNTTFQAGLDADMDVWFPPANNIALNWGFEDGIAQNDWQLSGTLTPLITGFARLTGNYGLLLGQRSFDFSPMEIIDDGYKPKIAVDADGTIHIVWGNGDLYYVYRLVNGDWSQIQQIANNHYPLDELLVDKNGDLHGIGGTSEQNLYYVYRDKTTGQWSITTVINDGNWSWSPSLAVDNFGKAHVVWESHYPGQSVANVMYSYRLANGTFSTPLVFEDDFGDSRDPQIAIDSSNKIHIIWVSEQEYNAHKIMYVANRRGVWLQAQDVTGIVENAAYNNFSVEENGSVHFIWRDIPNYVPTIYYRYVNSDGVWSDIQNVAQTGWGGPMQTAVDTKGTFHIAWNAEGSIYHIQKGRNSGWLPVELLANTETDPQIMLDGFGNVHVIWGGGPYSDSQDDDIHHMQQIDSGTWSLPTNLSSGEDDPNSPNAVIDAGGSVHIVWEIVANNEPYQTEIHYRGSEFSSLSGDATVTQQITIPVTITAPTLSFVYRLGNVFAQNETAFSVKVDDGTTQTEVATFQESSLGWSHEWVNLISWAGQTISVSFTLQQAVGEPVAWVYLDEVSIGSTYPDSYMHVSDGNAAPGQEVGQRITYSNRGGAEASGVTITYTLPAGITFVSASIPPASTNPLVWHLPDLPAKSEPFEILVTARVNANTPAFTTLTSTAVISTDDPELELLNNQAEGHIYTALFRYLPIIVR
ncbi:MAG: PD40 domain-containing protein [Anaerolineae bacterium]|nr:PD40 domain-containing protein [Anaerolineae bacterium]